jgi:hypothetical protein
LQFPDKVAFKERCGSSKALTITLIAAGAAIAVVLWLAFSIHNWGTYLSRLPFG